MDKIIDSELNWLTRVLYSTLNLKQLNTSRNCYTSFIRKHNKEFQRNPSLYRRISLNYNELYYKRFLELS